mmetsp:Transcript_72344/g.215911  ORF Transcript_72344/g.215911 Transcript_72344/m.215911 type:complete len:226 (-) Transcript_72344:509-1186(-)
MLCFKRNVSAILRSSAATAPFSTILSRMAAYSSLLLRVSSRWNLVSPSSRSMDRRSSKSLFRTFCMPASVQTSSLQVVRVTSSAISCERVGCWPARDQRMRKPISPSQLPAWPPSSNRFTCIWRPQQTATSPSKSSIKLDRGPRLCRRNCPAATSTSLADFLRQRNWRRVTPEFEKCLLYRRRSSGEMSTPFTRSRTKRSIMLRFAMPKIMPHTMGPQRIGCLVP